MRNPKRRNRKCNGKGSDKLSYPHAVRGISPLRRMGIHGNGGERGGRLMTVVANGEEKRGLMAMAMADEETRESEREESCGQSN